jgi:hypothetical protein
MGSYQLVYTAILLQIFRCKDEQGFIRKQKGLDKVLTRLTYPIAKPLSKWLHKSRVNISKWSHMNAEAPGFPR